MEKAIDLKAMGERIRQQRKQRNITQEDLAKMARVSMSFIGQLERGEKKASVETVAVLCLCFEVSLDYLVFGKRYHCDKENCVLYEDMKATLNRYSSVKL